MVFRFLGCSRLFVFTVRCGSVFSVVEASRLFRWLMVFFVVRWGSRFLRPRLKFSQLFCVLLENGFVCLASFCLVLCPAVLSGVLLAGGGIRGGVVRQRLGRNYMHYATIFPQIWWCSLRASFE